MDRRPNTPPPPRLSVTHACAWRSGPIALQRGAAIVETVIALPILLVVILGAIQFGLIYQAKATVNHASLQAARAGAVENADPDAIRRGLARGLAPLHSPDSSLAGVISTVARINADLVSDARIRILNPTREAFADFGEDVNGVREIPNDRLHARSTIAGAQSGLNIQDANILRVEITYGYELKVPLVNWFITRTLLAVRAGRTMDPFEQQLLRRTLLPVVATATVRMQSPARMSGLVVALADLPEVERFDAASRPPDDDEDESGENEEDEGDSGEGAHEGSSLGDGFLGFGGGPADGSGGGEASPGTGAGGGSGGGSGGSGGGNNGNPQQCSVDEPAPSPFPPNNEPPGDSSPVTPGPRDPFDNISLSGGATLPGIELPNLAVGNPIHVATGNKYQAEIDLHALPGALSIGFTRHYNSAAADRAGVMGAGWRHSWEATLHVVSGEQRTENGAEKVVKAAPAPSVLFLTQADGRKLKFTQRADEPGRYVAQRASDGELIGRPNAYVWRWPSGRELMFDASGLLIEIRHRSHVLRLQYNDAQQLSRIVDPQQRDLHFRYYANGRLAAISAAHGVKIRYTYDEHGNLSTVSRDSTVRRYHYEDARFPHHLTGISRALAGPQSYGARPRTERVATWKYDAQGRGVYSSHPDDAGKVTLSYQDGYTEVTDAFGQVSRYSTQVRDGLAFVTEVRGPGCSACGRGDVSYDFNEHFQVTALAKKHEPTQRFRYDALNRLVETQREIDGKIETLVAYRYEAGSHRPASIERPSVNPADAHTLHVSYRPDGQPEWLHEHGYTPLSGGGFAPIERKFSFGYDDDRLIWIDGPRIDVSDITRYEYDREGRLVATVAPDGWEQRILATDAVGRPTRIKTSGAPPIQITYDGIGRITAVAQQRATGERTVHYRYDAFGRLKEIEDPDGRVQRIGYDAAGRPARRISDVSGVTQAIAFSADDKVEKTALLSRSGQVLRMLHFAYDAQRRLTEVRDGDGPPLRQLIYDDGDTRPDVAVNQLGGETRLDYDALGQLASMISPDGGVTQLDYDAAGRMMQLVAPNNAQTSWRYDDFGRRVHEHSADRGETRYAYDSAGNLIERVDARGERTRFEYTAGNRLAAVTAREGVTKFSYVDGRLSRLSGPWGAESYDYDEDGNLVEHTRKTGQHEFTTRFRYDSTGRVKQRQLPSGEWLNHEYDASGELIRIARNQLFRTRTLVSREDTDTRRPLNPLAQLKFGNGLKLNNTFDKDGRLASRKVSGLNALSYEYDEADRVVAIKGKQSRTRYSYDDANRLTTATTPRLTLEYAYDANGNRQTVRRGVLDGRNRHSEADRGRESPHLTHASYEPESEVAPDAGNATSRSYVYLPNTNRLLSIDDARDAIRYDAAGNPLQIGERRYEYNSAGRPTRLFIDDELTAEYGYNLWGERTSKTLHSSAQPVTTHYVYEQHRLIAETDDRGRITREYLYLKHHPVAMLDHGAPYWIHTNHLGAPFAVTDENRQTVWRAEYEPFGAAEFEKDPDRDGRNLTLNLRLPGQYADAESGTYYNIMRDYDPNTGRYLTPDPLGVAAGANTFAYVRGNPVNSFDPLGLYDEMVHYYMTYFLALVAGLPQDAARTIAIAAQYVDENRLTAPVNWVFIANRRALPLYHFVMSEEGPLYGDRSQDLLTRFYDPSSNQLNNLLASTNPGALMRLWEQANPDLNACPAPSVINDARYQLYGEYLHAFEDTFSHRDSLNVPYGVRSNSENTPVATYGGHTGLGTANPLRFEPPDNSYNQDYDDDPSECLIGNTVLTRRVLFNRTESQCRNLSGQYTPPQTNSWEFNELRTLRMEHEIFEMLGNAFQDEIAANRERYRDADLVLATIDWRQLAGRSWDTRDPEANARIGLDLSYDQWRRSQMLSEANTVLQRYNASDADAEIRLEILNEWLADRGLTDLNGNALEIELWHEVDNFGARNRWDNIGWIPAGSFVGGVLLPRDERCVQPRDMLVDCDDRPRR